MNSAIQTPDSRRRKMRKGTRSCWECKRRKIRCTFARPGDAVCVGCARRCTECVTQDHPEKRSSAVAQGRLVGDRIGRVEVIVAQLVKQTVDEQLTSRMPNPSLGRLTADNSGIPTPQSTISAIVTSSPSPSGPYEGTKPQRRPNEAHTSSLLDRELPLKRTASEDLGYEDLAEKLLASFPPDKDLDMIVAASGNLAYYFLQRSTKSFGYFRNSEFESITNLTIRYTIKTHPVLIARQMLMLAIVILHTDYDRLNTIKGLSAPPYATMERLAKTAIDLIATNDDMTDTVEGIECIMLQSTYEEDNGNLRQSWIAWRRAVSIAQVMGLHRQNPPPLRSIRTNEAVDAHLLWNRLLYVDRFLSLMLGLPQAVSENPENSQHRAQFGESMDQLEHIHSHVASKILRRNELGPGLSDLTFIQEIDVELQSGAEKLPSRWWLSPNLASAKDEVQVFWETSRLRSQVYHYNLLNQLHLPCMLHPSTGLNSPQHDYSRMTCVNASRDLLSRYNMCRAFNTSASSCRVVDSFALWAAMTLLFAHIDGHRSVSPAERILGHQRLCDRAMVEQALEHMELIDHTNDYQFKAKSAKFLEKMLAIEEDVSRGLKICLVTGGGGPSSANILRIDIPYVGLITITKDDMNAGLEHHGAAGTLGSQTATYADTGFSGNATPHTGPNDLTMPVMEAVETRPMDLDVAHDTNTSGLSQSFHSDLNGEPNQWAYQGIDLPFFDSLMREANQLPTNDSNDWFLSIGN